MITGIELPIIVGSQSLFGTTTHVPDIVKGSIECDFLLLAVGQNAFLEVMAQVGFASEFQEINGYHADALGLATVVLPPGWRERLVPLYDPSGGIRAYCLDVLDTCVSKLIAGRDKDFEFVKALLESELIRLDQFLERADLIRELAESAALVPRLERLESFISKNSTMLDARPIEEFIRRLR